MARLVLNTFGDRTTIPIAQVVLADNSKTNLLRYIGNKLNWWNLHDFTRIPKEWKVIAHHMTISYGEPFTEKLQEDIDNEKGVLIMTDDIKIRNNRLNLLSLIRNYSLKIADFTLLNS